MSSPLFWRLRSSCRWRARHPDDSPPIPLVDEGIHDALPHAHLLPPPQPPVGRGVVPVLGRDVYPPASGDEDEEYPVDDRTVVGSGSALLGSSGQEGLYPAPPHVVQLLEFHRQREQTCASQRQRQEPETKGLSFEIGSMHLHCQGSRRTAVMGQPT